MSCTLFIFATTSKKIHQIDTETTWPLKCEYGDDVKISTFGEHFSPALQIKPKKMYIYLIPMISVWQHMNWSKFSAYLTEQDLCISLLAALFSEQPPADCVNAKGTHCHIKKRLPAPGGFAACTDMCDAFAFLSAHSQFPMLAEWVILILLW